MGVDRTIDVTTGQRKIILELLERHLPDTVAWVYGSRAKWTSRPQSDLDLVVFSTPHQRSRIGALREAFEESDLPFRVDLFVWDEVPETFREQIELEHVVLAVARTPSTSRNSTLAGEWTESTLGEVADFVSGGTPAKSHVEYWGGSIPWVSAKDMKRFRLDDTEDHVTEAGVENGTKLVPEGTVLLLTRGMTLINDVPICVAQRPMTFNQDVKALRPKPRVVSEYLPYLLLGNKQRLLSRVDLAGHGTGRLNSDELKTLDILLPAFPEEQRTIAHVLGTLDDKIELSRRMNDTLEAMTRALFKSWFVDFDPVRAKMVLNHHSPLGGESARQGRSPRSSRWGDVCRRYRRQTLDRAKALRRNQTDAEGLLWHYLRNRQLDGYKFRRQQPIGPYIADFACLSAKLVIELDGGQHAERTERDTTRDRFLRAEGYRVLRFWNNEVFESCFAVLERIHLALSDFTPPSERKRRGEGEPRDRAVGSMVAAVADGVLPPRQSAPVARPSANPPQGGSDWSVERARAYLDAMDPAIADLFPDRFVHSELGEIPEGWEVGILGDVAEHLRRSVRPSQIDPEMPYIALEHMPKRCIALSSWATGGGIESNKFEFNQGDILFGKLRPYFHKVGVAPTDGICSTDIVVIGPRRPAWFSYVLGHVSGVEFVDYTDAGAMGTRMPRTSWNEMARYQVVLPPEPIAKEFDMLVRPSVERIIANGHESRMLNAVRALLLPKLISGEIRLGEAEKAVDALT